MLYRIGIGREVDVSVYTIHTPPAPVTNLSRNQKLSTICIYRSYCPERLTKGIEISIYSHTPMCDTYIICHVKFMYRRRYTSIADWCVIHLPRYGGWLRQSGVGVLTDWCFGVLLFCSCGKTTKYVVLICWRCAITTKQSNNTIPTCQHDKTRLPYWATIQGGYKPQREPRIDTAYFC
jgi:hypothetical protein